MLRYTLNETQTHQHLQILRMKEILNIKDEKTVREAHFTTQLAFTLTIFFQFNLNQSHEGL